MSGQTIEVINTDAEGRLVLCDVMTYAQKKFAPRAMIEFSTLTGAIIIALGHERAGLFSNNTELSNKLRDAGAKVGEKLWRMPLGDAYDKLLTSDIADMRNVGGGRDAGSISAAQFLKRFVEGDRPWAHIDIAGTAWSTRATTRPRAPRPSACGWSTVRRRQSGELIASDIRFYHLMRGSIEDVLPRSLERTLAAGKRAVVLLGSAERVEERSTRICGPSTRAASCRTARRATHAERQPVWLTHVEENPNGAQFLFVADSARTSRPDEWERVSEIFDGRDDARSPMRASAGAATGPAATCSSTGSRANAAAGRRRPEAPPRQPATRRRSRTASHASTTGIQPSQRNACSA